MSTLGVSNEKCSDYIAHLDGVTVIKGGWLNHHWIQMGYQLADSFSGFAYSFGGSCIILFIINLIPGLNLRATEENEILGIDDAEIGEFAVSIHWHLILATNLTWPNSTTMLNSHGKLLTTPPVKLHQSTPKIPVSPTRSP
jgi:hypothetical protein